jgi:hypothetical protein
VDTEDDTREPPTLPDGAAARAGSDGSAPGGEGLLERIARLSTTYGCGIKFLRHRRLERPPRVVGPG